MPILNKKEKNLIEEKWENDVELSLEEISDLQETLDKEEGFHQPRRIEIIDDDNNITWEYIDQIQI